MKYSYKYWLDGYNKLGTDFYGLIFPAFKTLAC